MIAVLTLRLVPRPATAQTTSFSLGSRASPEPMPWRMTSFLPGNSTSPMGSSRHLRGTTSTRLIRRRPWLGRGFGFLGLLGELALQFAGLGRQLVGAGLGQPVVEAADMLDRAQAVGRHAQLDALPERVRDQRHILQIGQKGPLGLVEIGRAHV